MSKQQTEIPAVLENLGTIEEKVKKIAPPTKEVEDLMKLGLTRKEAEIVQAKRNARSESLGIRLNADELAGLKKVQEYLVLHGYVNDGMANTIVYMVNSFVYPEERQLSINSES